MRQLSNDIQLPSTEKLFHMVGYDRLEGLRWELTDRGESHHENVMVDGRTSQQVETFDWVFNIKNNNQRQHAKFEVIAAFAAAVSAHERVIRGRAEGSLLRFQSPDDSS